MFKQRAGWKRQKNCMFIGDHDRKIFNVIEGYGSEPFWKKQVEKARAQNRNVNCWPSEKTVAEIRQDFEGRGYTYSRDTVLTFNE